MMNRKQKAKITVCAAAAAGFGVTYGTLYYRAMHPGIPRPAKGKRRIACIGDSLTYGWGLMGAFRKYAYPAVLQEKLGEAYQVMNFGICDRTLRDGADKPYRNEKIYAASLASEPEIVIIMLGTNDAKPGNWNAEGYGNDLRSFVSVYRDLASRPDVILIQPPITFGVLGEALNDAISGEMHEIIGKTGRENGCTVIDLNAITEGHREWFADGIHLNRLGTNVVAEAVFEAVRRKK